MTPADRRRVLSDALCGPMPHGFIWNYRVAHGCAISVAMKLWPHRVRNCVPDLARFFGLTEPDVLDVFYGDYGVPLQDVTSGMVADRLETIGG